MQYAAAAAPVRPQPAMVRAASKLKSPTPPPASLPRFFGRRLEDQAAQPDTSVPLLLAVCCDFLRRNGGLSAEGIFRVEGSRVRQRDLRARLERGLPISEATPLQDVSSVLKAWLRELPEPLLPARLASALAATASPLERRVRLLRLLGLFLPERQLASLRCLCALLRQIAANSGANRMTPANLATCLGPSLYGGGPGDTASLARLNTAVALLIEFAPEIGVSAAAAAENVAAATADAAAIEASSSSCAANPPATSSNALQQQQQHQDQEKQQQQEPQQPQQKPPKRRSSSGAAGSLGNALRAVGRAVGRLASRSRSRSPRSAAPFSASNSPAAPTAAPAATTSLSNFRFDPNATHTPVIVRCRRRQRRHLACNNNNNAADTTEAEFAAKTADEISSSNSNSNNSGSGGGAPRSVVQLVGENSKDADSGGCVGHGQRRRRFLLERLSAGRKASVDLSVGVRSSPPPPPLRRPSASFSSSTPPSRPPPPMLAPAPPQPPQTRTPLRRLQRSPRDSLQALRQARSRRGAASPRRPDRLRCVRRLVCSPLRLSQHTRLCLLRAEGLMKPPSAPAEI